MKVAGTLIRALFIIVVASLFYQSFRRLPLDDGLATIKTLGFWGLCGVILCLTMVALGTSKTKGHGVVIAVNLSGIIVCVFVYGLLFGPK